MVDISSWESRRDTQYLKCDCRKEVLVETRGQCCILIAHLVCSLPSEATCGVDLSRMQRERRGRAQGPTRRRPSPTQAERRTKLADRRPRPWRVPAALSAACALPSPRDVTRLGASLQPPKCCVAHPDPLPPAASLSFNLGLSSWQCRAPCVRW